MHSALVLPTAVAVWITMTAGKTGAQGSSCLPADSLSAHLVDYVVEVVTGSDSTDAALRQRLGFAGVQASQVSAVTSGQACKKAADAFDQLAGTPSSGRRVYVVKVGKSRYVVRDPGDKAGEWGSVHVFTGTFSYVATLLGP
jgi:hypothetical protein